MAVPHAAAQAAPAPPAAPVTWDEDPSGVSLTLATGRRRHDLLVIAEPALLTELDAAWGRPASRTPLSFLPGVSAPTGPGYADAVDSYERAGHGVLVVRGRTSAYEGKPTRRVTAMARIAAGAGVRSAVVLMRASSLGAATPGDFLAVGDHLTLGGAVLFASSTPVDAAWDEELTRRTAEVEGVRGTGLMALLPGPLRATAAQARVLSGLGADATIMDGVGEAMMLASRGVRVAGLAYVDRVAPGVDDAAQPRPVGRRVARDGRSDRRSDGLERALRRRPAPDVVRDVVETVLDSLG